MNDTIIQSTRQNVYSVDGTAWNATFKERRYEGRTKVEQSVVNIRRKQALVEPIRLENGDSIPTPMGKSRCLCNRTNGAIVTDIRFDNNRWYPATSYATLRHPLSLTLTLEGLVTLI